MGNSKNSIRQRKKRKFTGNQYLSSEIPIDVSAVQNSSLIKIKSAKIENNEDETCGNILIDMNILSTVLVELKIVMRI